MCCAGNRDHLLQRRPQLRSVFRREVGLQMVIGLIWPKEGAGFSRQVLAEVFQAPL